MCHIDGFTGDVIKGYIDGFAGGVIKGYIDGFAGGVSYESIMDDVI